MTCPSCHRSAISFIRYALMIDPRWLHCDHCGAELVLSRQSKRAWWGSLLFGAVLVIVSIVLRRIVGWSLLTNLAGIVVMSLAISYHFWRSAVYHSKTVEVQRPSELELP
jgi:hypothetical protein